MYSGDVLAVAFDYIDERDLPDGAVAAHEQHRFVAERGGERLSQYKPRQRELQTTPPRRGCAVRGCSATGGQLSDGSSASTGTAGAGTTITSTSGYETMATPEDATEPVCSGS